MDLGVCWYPEQWPREEWAADTVKMADIGLSYVRIGEFAWAAYEPARGKFKWDWLDEAIAAADDAGLHVILGTPTATPPIWLAVEQPEILAVDVSGRRKPYGTRRHTCPTSTAYRQESKRIVETLVARYGSHPAVVAWQIDNEPGNHNSASCWCDECEAAFSRWLEHRYETIEALNDSWGTIFWSQTYSDFEAVLLPRPAPTTHSPSLLLAHRRFASRQVIDGLDQQASVIAAGSPGRDMAVNFYAGDTFIDYRAAARIGGIGAIDSYPDGAASPEEVRFWHDLARGISGKNRGWIMEQQPGAINWTALNPPVPDGQVAQWLEDAAADGIELSLIFRWRAALAGQEQYHTAMLRHDGSPDRALSEVATAQVEIEQSVADIALVYEYEDAWVFDIEPHQVGLTHRSLVVAAHSAAKMHGAVDVVGWEDDFSSYNLLVVPAAVIGTSERAADVLAAAENGATVIVGPRSLSRTAESTAFARPIPAFLSDAIGASLVEALSMPADEVLADGSPIGPWLDVLESAHGDVLLSHGGPGHLEKTPTAVSVAHGTGRVVLMGASSPGSWMALLERLDRAHS